MTANKIFENTEYLYYRDFFRPYHKQNIVYDHNKDKIMKVPMHFNKYGYRSPDFTGTEELLVLGCSQTMGYGMLEGHTWPELLAKQLEMKYSRIAFGGESIQSQVIKAFQYFKKFGNPKIVVGTFPLFRIEMPSIPNKFSKEDKKDISIDQLFLHRESFDKYSKAPHNPESVLPQEVAIFYSFIFIQLLEYYCETNNIIFVWNLWEDEDRSCYKYIKNNEKIKHLLKNYYVSNNLDDGRDPIFNYESDFKNNCHEEHANHELFYYAADYTDDFTRGHWGYHKHIHVADFFYNIIKERII